MRDHNGPPESRKTRNKCREQSPDRSGRQTGVNQPPQQSSFPLKPSDSPSVDLGIDDNCKPTPPETPPPGPPPPPSGPAWNHVVCQNFCFVVLVWGGWGGAFQLNARLCSGTPGRRFPSRSSRRRRTTLPASLRGGGGLSALGKEARL